MANANAELRRLMQLKKASSAKRVNHPLAKYNNLEQLSCVICSKVIKDDSLWNPHLQSKKHKENVLLVKNKTSAPKSTSNGPKLSHAPKTSNGKPSNKQLPGDFFDKGTGHGNNTQPTHNKNPPIKPRSILKNSHSQSSSNEKDNDLPIKPITSILKNSPHPQSDTKPVGISKQTSNINDSCTNNKSDSRKRKADDAGLPADFFDEGVKNDISNDAQPTNSDMNEERTDQDKTTTSTDDSSVLPEGFFDDPKRDAAARNVEYKDPKEKEWESFQKVIQEETKVSEAIQEEDDEESEMHKDLTELNKMKSCLSRVENLKGLIGKEKEKKLAMLAKSEYDDHSDDNYEDSDEDIEDIFDWRAKSVN